MKVLEKASHHHRQCYIDGGRDMIYCEAALEAAEIYGRRIRPNITHNNRRGSPVRRPRRRTGLRRARTRHSTVTGTSRTSHINRSPTYDDLGHCTSSPNGYGVRIMSSDYAVRCTQENIDREGHHHNSDTETSVSDFSDSDESPEYVILSRSVSEPVLRAMSASPTGPRAVLAPFQSATISFPYPTYMNLKRAGRTAPIVKHVVRFKIQQDQVPDYQVLSRVALSAGLKPTRSTARCNLYWGKTLPPDKWELLTSVQKVNHFPGSQALSRKDKLAQNLRQQCSDFIPETFVLPEDRIAFQTAAGTAIDTIWIQKPYASSCGRGIRLIDRYSQLGARCKSVLSRYIDRPYLINHHKFDVRLYFVITCLDPLRIYTLDDGLVRFATQRYSLERATFKEKCVHLTNFAVNRHSKNFVKSGATGDIGSKWSYKALLAHLGKQHNIETVDLVRDRIHDIAIRSIIAVEHIMFDKMQTYRCPRKACFEVLGFDILLDADLHPWLLEVNSQPSLGTPSALDKFIKTKLMTDVFHIIGIPAIENDLRTIRRTQTRRLKRVIGLGKPEQIVNSSRPPSPLTKSTVSEHDIEILREFEAEDQRRGHLVRIFPTQNTQAHLSRFREQRYNNILLDQWLSLPRQQALEIIQ